MKARRKRKGLRKPSALRMPLDGSTGGAGLSPLRIQGVKLDYQPPVTGVIRIHTGEDN